MRTAVCLLSILLAVGASADPKKMTVAVEGNEVVVRGVSPGADIFLFGMAHEPTPYTMAFAPVEQRRADEDRDGIVRFAYPNLPKVSVFVAIDERSGDMAAAAGVAAALKYVDVGNSAFKSPKGDDFESLQFDRHSVEIAVLRPGRGVWRLSADEGGAFDTDGSRNGRIVVSTGKMRKLRRDSDAIAAFSPGDVIVAIDTYSLEIITVRYTR